MGEGERKVRGFGSEISENMMTGSPSTMNKVFYG